METIGKFVVAGTCLCIGFWIGKKITNQVDYLLFTQSPKFKEMKKQFESLVHTQKDTNVTAQQQTAAI